jgi:uncharacterized protein (DUF3084 family)
VADQTRSDAERESTPRQLAEVTPSYQQAVGAQWLTEAVMQIQASVAELKSDVKHLTTASEKQSSKLDKLSHRMYAAGAVIVVLTGIGGFFLNKIWDGLVIAMKAGGH